MDKKQNLRYVFVALFCSLGLTAVSPTETSADIVSQFGYSPRAIGMGNAYTAIADDFSGFYYNPAGVGSNLKNVVTFGYLYNQPDVMIKAGGVESVGFDSKLQGGVAGFRLDFTPYMNQFMENRDFGFLPERFRPNMGVGWGISILFPDNFKTFVNADTVYPDALQFPVFGRVHDLGLIFAGAGIKYNDWIFFGASMRVGFTAAIQNATVYMDFRDMSNPQVVFNKMDVNPDLEIAPILGILVKPWEEVSFGAAWRKGMNPVHFHGKVNVSIGTPVGGFSLPPFGVSIYEIYQPEEYAVSATYELFDKKLLAALDVMYAVWTGYDLPNGIKPEGKPFKDIIIPRIGLEYSLDKELKVRGGYYYQPSPLKDKQPFTQLLDTDQHVFSAGLGYLWTYPEEYIGFPVMIDLYLQYQYLPRRTIQTLTGPISIWGKHLGGGAAIQVQF